MNRNSIDNDVIILRKKQPPVKGEKAINDARRKGTEVQTQTKCLYFSHDNSFFGPVTA